MSALYGHGLVRDMYGNDAATNGYYDRNPDGSLPTDHRRRRYLVPAARCSAMYQVTTNIPAYVGHNFAGWILRIPAVTINNTYYQSSTFTVGDTNGDGAACHHRQRLLPARPLRRRRELGHQRPDDGADR